MPPILLSFSPTYRGHTRFSRILSSRGKFLDVRNRWPKKNLRRYGVGLYPAAFTSTSDSINTVWSSTSP
ncbi:hypothetical protein POPTR_008G139800v4 [Populus trichocarpa]|uniref:Uncharacterized protein n=1 Tax=Populus trichocarpa TaxID=3694 RepID=A0A2K1ZGZ5_POPTR|nr:hypothetical protein POPTR_008G139800v4 [Populus trichocarpa]